MKYFFANPKGGVGKSFTCLACAKYLYEQKKKFIVIETDDQNPALKSTFDNNNKIESIEFGSYALNENDEKRTIDLINTIEEAKNDILINTPAQSLPFFVKYGKFINKIPETKIIFVINTEQDNFNHLKKFSAIFDHIFVVKNGYFGSEEDFMGFNNRNNDSKFGKILPSVYFPKAKNFITDRVFTKRESIFTIENSLSFGEKMYYENWKEDAMKAVGEIFNTI